MASSSSDWICRTQREAGFVLGVSARTIQEYIARGCPGRKGHYPLIEIIAWLKEFVWNRWAAELADGDEMLMGDGAKSDALERFRDERAKLARLDRLAREGQLLVREDVHDGLVVFSERMRRALADIQKDHPEAWTILSEALNEIEEAYHDRFGQVTATH